MSVSRLLDRGRERLVLIDDAESLTGAQVVDRVDQWRARLAERDVEDRVVAFVADNGIGFVVALLAILGAGATAAPLDPALPPDALREAVATSGACLLFRVGEGPSFAACRGRASVPAELRGVLFRSSGTAGQPKQALLTESAIVTNVEAISAYLEPGHDEVFQVVKTMVHSSTIVGEILVAIAAGATLVARSRTLSPRELFRRVHEHRATFVGVNPTLLRFFSGPGAAPELLGSLRTLHVSGAIVDRRVYRAVHERFPDIRLINGYGLTEAGPRVAQHDSARSFKAGSVGRAVDGVSIRVRRDDRSSCEVGERGQVYVATPSLMAGYWRDGELTAPSLHEGELATGDLGYFDDEGDLHIVGRCDDLVVSAGHSVQPEEVEELISRASASIGISDCLVFGGPDPLLGQRLICAVVPSDPAADPEQLRRRVRERCARVLPAHRQPKVIAVWDALPLGETGKRSRRAALEVYLGEAGPRSLSVVIPCYGRAPELLAVLRGFDRQRFAATRFEVVVVDDGSPEPLADHVDPGDYRYPLRLVRQRNLGRSAARNRGVEVAEGELLVFCDADRLPDPEFLAEHARAHASRAPLAVVGAPLDCFYRKSSLLSAAGVAPSVMRRFARKPEYVRAIEALFDGERTNSPIAWAAFLVGNSSVRRQDFVRAGQFDESMRNWGLEHFDLGLRLIEASEVEVRLAARAINYHIPHSRDLQQARAWIEEASGLIQAKHPARRTAGLGRFLLGEWSLQQFEADYAGRLSASLARRPAVYFRGLARDR